MHLGGRTAPPYTLLPPVFASRRGRRPEPGFAYPISRMATGPYGWVKPACVMAVPHPGKLGLTLTIPDPMLTPCRFVVPFTQMPKSKWMEVLGKEH